jgi:hypothetical protein
MTRETTGSHLHWGLKHGDQYTNPGLVIQEMFRIKYLLEVHSNSSGLSLITNRQNAN